MTELMDVRAAAASRAQGALVLAVFGSLWMAGALSLYANMGPAAAGEIAAAALLTLGVALPILVVAGRTAVRLRRWSRPWPAPVARGFWVVNLAQYAALGLVVSQMANNSRQIWIVPLATAIVGLHFLPLARLFRSPPHAWIGVAMLMAAGGEALLRRSPFSPAGIFAGGAVLLGGALLLARTAMRSARSAA